VKTAALEADVERLTAAGAAADREQVREVFTALRQSLSRGAIRAAEPDAASPSGWRVNAWVKRGILLGFKFGVTVESHLTANQERWPFLDKDTLPLKQVHVQSGIRIVPGGSSVRDGAFLGRGVICMPPMYINIGAYVGDETLVDSHALVGSCAQIGARVHLSAAAQIGGVLEPVGALPVIIEDDVLVGGNCGVYEGTIVRARAVLAAGVVLTRGTPVFDLVRETVYKAGGDTPLEIPEAAVVVPGSRAIKSGWGADQQLGLQAPVIVKYRDEKTDLATTLESWLR